MGRIGNLESVTKRFCLIYSPSSSIFKTMFGGGTWEGGSCEEKNADFAGETGISPERVLGGGRGGRMKKHLNINLFVTLALEVALKVRASMAQSEARGGGRRCGGVE